MKIKISNKLIDCNSEPFIIGEVGSNFDQDLNKAIKLIKIAKNAGCDAVKFQLFKASKLYPNDLKMRNIFKKLEIKKKFLVQIKRACMAINIEFMCSPFDLESVKYLYKIGINSFKIASSEISNYKLIKFVASTKKLCIVSLGMAIEEDVIKIKKIFRKIKNQNLVFMQCTSEYPASLENSNLKYINHIKKNHKCIPGYSDHTLNSDTALVALGMGAIFFEKHFTYNKKAKGPDHFFALNPKELFEYVRKIKQCHASLGSEKKNQLLDSLKNFSRRKGIYAKENLIKNTIIKNKHLEFKSPPKGLLDIEIKKILNKRIKKSKNKLDYLSYQDF